MTYPSPPLAADRARDAKIARYGVRACSNYDIDGTHWHVTLDGRDMPGLTYSTESTAKAEAARKQAAAALAVLTEAKT